MFKNILILVLVTMNINSSLGSQFGTCTKLYKLAFDDIFDIMVHIDENANISNDLLKNFTNSILGILSKCHNVKYDESRVNMCVEEYSLALGFITKFIDSIKSGDLYLILADLFPLLGKLVNSTVKCLNVNNSIKLARLENMF